MAHLLEPDLNHILEYVKGLQPELRNARLFVTGATGFMGRWMLESFLWMNKHLELNAEAVILMRPGRDFHFPWPEAHKDLSLKFHRGDVRDFAFPEGAFTHVIHAAGSASPGYDGLDPLETFDTIVEGTRRALELARMKKVKGFLLTSSGAVYGKQPADLLNIPEDYGGAPDASDPRFSYSEGKRVAELLGFYYSKLFSTNVKIARCFGFMGPFTPLDRGFALGNFVRNCLSGAPIQITGDGTNHRSYLYAADLAIWLWTILVRGKVAYPYNVGCEESHSVVEIAETVRASFSQKELPIHVAKSPDPGVAPQRYAPCTRRARTELGLHAWTPFRTGIEKTAAFYQATL